MQSPPYLKFVGERGVDTLHKAEEYLDSYFLASEREHGFGYKVVRNCRAEALGMVGMMQRDYMRYPDIGFAFLPQNFGKGLALYSTREYLRTVQERGDIAMIEAFTDCGNLPAQNLLARLNFNLVNQFLHPQNGNPMRVYQRAL